MQPWSGGEQVDGVLGLRQAPGEPGRVRADRGGAAGGDCRPVGVGWQAWLFGPGTQDQLGLQVTNRLGPGVVGEPE